LATAGGNLHLQVYETKANQSLVAVDKMLDEIAREADE